MTNLILTLGATVLSFCVVVFFTITFANIIESIIAKRDMKRAMKDDILIVEATKDDCSCQGCCHSHNIESVHDEEE